MSFLKHCFGDFLSSDIVVFFLVDNENEKLRDIIIEVSEEVFYPFGEIKNIYEYGILKKEEIEKLNPKNFKGKFLSFFTDLHDKTYYSFKFCKNIEKNTKLIIMDAHPDCFEDGMEINYQNFLKRLIDNKIINPEDILLLGIRNYSLDELNFLKENNIKYITSWDIIEDFSNTLKIIKKFSKNNIVYLSIDLDVLSTSKTNWIEPLGLTEREILKIIYEISSSIKFIDFTEALLNTQGKYLWKLAYYLLLLIASKK